MKTFEIAADCAPNREGYDSLMYWPPLLEYYCHSDFVNYGYWQKDTADARQASELLVEKLLRFLPARAGTILDVACGKGASTRYLLRSFAASQIIGINNSPAQLETCRQNAPQCDFRLMDAVQLDFPDQSFDTVLCVEAAFHFNTRKRFFAEALRVLKPGGHLVLSDILLSREAEERRKYRFVENYLESPEHYEKALRDCGFTDLRVEDATEACVHGSFRHLVTFSHRKLLDGEMTPESLKNFMKRVIEFVPEIRYYLLACGRKPQGRTTTS